MLISLVMQKNKMTAIGSMWLIMFLNNTRKNYRTALNKISMILFSHKILRPCFK